MFHLYCSYFILYSFGRNVSGKRYTPFTKPTDEMTSQRIGRVVKSLRRQSFVSESVTKVQTTGTYEMAYNRRTETYTKELQVLGYKKQ